MQQFSCFVADLVIVFSFLLLTDWWNWSGLKRVPPHVAIPVTGMVLLSFGWWKCFVDLVSNGNMPSNGNGMASGRMTSFGSSSSPMLAKLSRDPSAFLRLSGRTSWISLEPLIVTVDLLMKVTKTWKTGMLWEMLTIVVSMIPCLLFLVSYCACQKGLIMNK